MCTDSYGVPKFRSHPLLPVLFHTQVVFPSASAYDLQFSITTDHGALTSLFIDSANTTGSSCLIGSLSCSVINRSMFSCSSLPTDCAASVVMSAELPMSVVAGNNITIETTLQYDSNPFSAPHTGVMYTPLDVSVNVYLFHNGVWNGRYNKVYMCSLSKVAT